MKKIILLSVLLISANTKASDFSFTYFGNDSYYACSYVEDQTVTFLELMGATKIDVRCSGGINNGPWSPQPVSIRAKYELPEVSTEVMETVEVEGDAFNPACGLNVRIIKEVLKTMPQVQVLKKQDACAFVNSNYYFKLYIPR